MPHEGPALAHEERPQKTDIFRAGHGQSDERHERREDDHLRHPSIAMSGDQEACDIFFDQLGPPSESSLRTEPGSATLADWMIRTGKRFRRLTGARPSLDQHKDEESWRARSRRCRDGELRRDRSIASRRFMENHGGKSRFSRGCLEYTHLFRRLWFLRWAKLRIVSYGRKKSAINCLSSLMETGRRSVA